MATDAQITVHIDAERLSDRYDGEGWSFIADHYGINRNPTIAAALGYALSQLGVSWEWDEGDHDARSNRRYLKHNGRRFTARRSLFYGDGPGLEALAAIGVPFELEEGPEDYDPTDHWVFHPEIGPGLVSSDDGAPTLAGLLEEMGSGLYVSAAWIRAYAERKSNGRRFDELVSGINP